MRPQTRTADIWLLCCRISVGLMFLIGAVKKVTDLDWFRDEFVALGAPFPHLTAPVTAWIELVGGALLILGAFTRVAAAALAATMVGALWLSVIPAIGKNFHTFPDRVSNFFYAPEWLLLLILALLVSMGAGRASVDSRRHA
ncbi:DoxX family protein [Nocardia ninae]|uniref:DoxX family protein n=1 Tax=Nocardia ninae NBRC 108245 TaxID=1210091 RepID=A0A511M7B9_9NOCA|nr:DoxX family protein [Nocardia ninae]GEM35596.1 hypothetical protein NN4_01150 [Nocardia ninae NBRC 108245]